MSPVNAIPARLVAPRKSDAPLIAAITRSVVQFRRELRESLRTGRLCAAVQESSEEKEPRQARKENRLAPQKSSVHCSLSATSQKGKSTAKEPIQKPRRKS